MIAFSIIGLVLVNFVACMLMDDPTQYLIVLGFCLLVFVTPYPIRALLLGLVFGLLG